MIKYSIAALLTGLLFGLMDGLINGNPVAINLMECYKPIARQTLNIPMGLLIDLFYGFVISGIFIIIRPALPTEIALIKGITFGVGMWIFRTVMYVASSWIMFTIPYKTLVYILLTGLVEMIVLGVLNGLILKK